MDDLTTRCATDSDMNAVYDWLRDEKARGVPGNFLCNWRLIESHHQNGDVYVCSDANYKAFPLAFIAGGLQFDGILQVRLEFQRKGIARRLVEEAIQRCRESDRRLLWIECAPQSSQAFWQSVGFTLLGGGPHAVRILPLAHELPVDAPQVNIEFRFFPESYKWTSDEKPVATISPEAAMTRNGIQLSERVFFFEALHPDIGDLVVEVFVDQQQIYCDKVKYPEAEQMGFSRCENGYQIDRLQAPK